MCIEPIKRKEDVEAVGRWLRENTTPAYYLAYIGGVFTGARSQEMISMLRYDPRAHISLNGFHRVLSRAVAECGVSCRVGLQTPRKTYGYFRIKEGMSLENLSKEFGHENPQTTAEYIGLYD